MNDLNSIGINVEVHDTPSDEEIYAPYLSEMFTPGKHGAKINENVFAEAFVEVNQLQYSNGLYYTREGKKTEDLIARDIWESIKEVITHDVGRTCDKLGKVVRLAATVENLGVNENIIPFRNGDFHLDTWTFHEGLTGPYPYRFPSRLSGTLQPTPHFTKWLGDLFTPEDQRVIQEYLGYCLVPSTKAQKALFLVGEGGAGKSVIGVILQAILGDAMLSTPNSQEFLQDKFKLAELEHKVVLYDDDLDNEALKSTGLYKKLITNQQTITADRKYGQPFKFRPYAKLVSCCNEMINSVYDNTEGFYRRLLPVLIKPKDPAFKPDPHFYDKIRGEIDGIIQWSLMGLNRLIGNDWVLSESERTKTYLKAKQADGDHFPEFMVSSFDLDTDGKLATVEIMSVYKTWCRANGVRPRADRTLQSWLRDNAEKYRIFYSNKIPYNGKFVRGFRGLSIANGEEKGVKIRLR